jgi:hypothetical protein
MATRDELLGAVSTRYLASSRAEKSRIVDEFTAATGYHRKHAMRLLRTGLSSKRSTPRPSRRIYGEAEREALIVLWEASDRVCGKRLKAIATPTIPGKGANDLTTGRSVPLWDLSGCRTDVKRTAHDPGDFGVATPSDAASGTRARG